jgi:hypothetical protein
MHRRTWSVVLLSCLLAASKSNDDSMKTADAVRSATSATGEVPTDPVCKLFSSKDAAHYIGKAAKNGAPAIGGCQWLAVSGAGQMMVQIVSARYDERPDKGPGYRKLPDVGPDAFVAKFLDGWMAGTVAGKEAIRAIVSGNGVTDATAIALLNETVKRHSVSR